MYKEITNEKRTEKESMTKRTCDYDSKSIHKQLNIKERANEHVKH